MSLPDARPSSIPGRGIFSLAALLVLLLPVSANALMHKDSITYQDGETVLQGKLYWEDSYQGKRPGILLLGERWGMNDYLMLRAEMLAELGYVVFAADMYGDGRVTRKVSEADGWRDQVTADSTAWRQRAALGLQQLRGQDKVHADKVAVVGYGFGADSALQLVYAGTALQGAAGFYGSLPVPTATEVAAIKARLWLARGALDPFLSAGQVRAFQAAFESSQVDWDMDVFGRAKHGFANPYADSYGIAGIQFHEISDRRSWSRLLLFLEELFVEEMIL